MPKPRPQKRSTTPIPQPKTWNIDSLVIPSSSNDAKAAEESDAQAVQIE